MKKHVKIPKEYVTINLIQQYKRMLVTIGRTFIQQILYPSSPLIYATKHRKQFMFKKVVSILYNSENKL